MKRLSVLLDTEKPRQRVTLKTSSGPLVIEVRAPQGSHPHSLDLYLDIGAEASIDVPKIIETLPGEDPLPWPPPTLLIPWARILSDPDIDGSVKARLIQDYPADVYAWLEQSGRTVPPPNPVHPNEVPRYCTRCGGRPHAPDRRQ